MHQVALNRNERALMSAVVDGNLQQLTRVMRRSGVSVKHMKFRWSIFLNNEPMCLLLLATIFGHVQLVPYLVAAGLSVEGCLQCSWTPLMVAAKNGHVEMVRALLAAGAEPLAQHRNDSGGTALHAAAANGHRECVSLLLPITTINITDNYGNSPVHFASLNGNTEVLQQLQLAGWNIQVEDGIKSSALHYAAKRGFVHTVAFLVEAGLCTTAKDACGFTPLDQAKLEGHHEVEGWLLKHCPEAAANACSLNILVKTCENDSIQKFQQCLVNISCNQLGNMQFAKLNHHQDGRGATLLHIAAEMGNLDAIMLLTDECGLHHHVLTYQHYTPADLALRAGRHQALLYLQQHRCNKGASLPDHLEELLYRELLTVITTSDDVAQASALICEGAPLRCVGPYHSDALTLAITCGRTGIVSLLLAAGAPLTSMFQGYNLQLLAWTSVNVTPTTLYTVTKTFIDVLRYEATRLSARHPTDLQQGIIYLITKLSSENPKQTCWPGGCSELELSNFLLEAVRANCPLTASFLRQAGAWSFIRSQSGTTVLHEALSHQNWQMTETLVRDLQACLYLPDGAGLYPADLMTPQQRDQFQKKLYDREKRKLEEIKQKCKTLREKKMMIGVQCVQQVMYQWRQLSADHQLRKYIPAAVQLAGRVGLQQLTFLLLHRAGVKVNGVVEPVTGATVLHLAAAHGKAGCVALLQAAGADPNKWDRYGHTAAHLAAMFGHNTTTQLLTQHSTPDLSSRAGATVTQVQQNFQQYLRCYREDGQTDLSENITHEEQDQDVATLRILDTIKVEQLVTKAEQVKVRFEGEAETVRSIVLREIKTLVEQVGQRNPIYQGQLVLVGSSSDGTKINAPDEFDINLVLDHPPPVQVTVTENNQDNYYKGKLRIQVETEESALQENSLMNNLYDVMMDVLSEHTLKDGRLSLVPPGLTRTQVGVALSLAWHGSDYPLLLVGVDLVPVVEVEWHPQVKKPPLTPPNSTTMYLSNMEDGSWRCSFAHTEAKVLNELSEQERRVYLVAKTMVSSLKAEPWMPTDIKAFYTWWCDRRYKIPLLTGFCLKNSFLRLLEKKRENDTNWMIEHTIDRVIQVFREMCTQPDGLTDNLYFGHSPAYFGGDFEGPKPGYGAPHIISYLDFHLNQGPKKIRSEQFSSKTH